MAKLDDTLELVVQRTGSTSGTPQNEAEAANFRSGIKLDIASIMGQLNSVYYPLVNTLSKETGIDALELGLAGNTVFTDIEASAASASAYWDTSLQRQRTIKETIDVLLSEISSLENTISFNVDVAAYDDTAVRALIGTNQLNLKQIRLDTMGSNYTFDNDGAADLTYSLSQAVDAIGAFFAGFPGTGNTYAGTYPTLALAVNLSDVVLDTTIPISTITDLSTYLNNIYSYTGMTNSGDTAPTYSTWGSIGTVSDGMSLEEAIQALDQDINDGAGIFEVVTNVTRNSGTGTDYDLDDFVFGSPQLDDDTVVTHDSRFLFDKSKGAFRAGVVDSTTWDDASRGTWSAAFGINTQASGANSFAAGRNNYASADGSFVGGGNTGGAGNSTISSGSDDSFVGAGVNNDIGSVFAATQAFIGSGVNNSINTNGSTTSSSNYSAIVAGYNNTIYDSPYAFIGAGGDNISAVNTIASSSHAVIVGGDAINITSSTYSSVVGGSDNDIITNSDYSFIGGGRSNGITDNVYSFVGGGRNNNISSTTGFYHFIGGGGDTSGGNTISGTGTTNSAIVGGDLNSIGSSYGFIGGGKRNSLTGEAEWCFIGGGGSNTVGEGNTITDTYQSAIVAGLDNIIQGVALSGATNVGNFIGGGQSNAIGDGIDNVTHNVIGGGFENTITGGDQNVIAGGGGVTTQSNVIVNGNWHVISGGRYNSIRNLNAGGTRNTITGGYFNRIGTGVGNLIDCTISGGASNLIGTGSNNGIFSGDNASISSGGNNVIVGGVSGLTMPSGSPTGAGLFAGQTNTLQSTRSVILGGFTNTISSTGTDNAILGGSNHTIQSITNQSAIIGGDNNLIDTTLNGNVIIASEDSDISSGSGYCMIAASQDAAISVGDYCAIIAGTGTGSSQNTLTSLGTGNAIIGSSDTTLSAGSRVSVIACDNSVHSGSGAENAIIASDFGTISSGSNSVILAGDTSSVTASHAVALGNRATARWYNTIVHGVGNGVCGHAMPSWLNNTTDDTTTELFLGNSGTDRLLINADEIMQFDIKVTASTSVNQIAVWQFSGAISRTGIASTTAIVYLNKTVDYIDASLAGVDVNVVADTTNGGATIQVDGLPVTNITWMATGSVHFIAI